MDLIEKLKIDTKNLNELTLYFYDHRSIKEINEIDYILILEKIKDYYNRQKDYYKQDIKMMNIIISDDFIND